MVTGGDWTERFRDRVEAGRVLAGMLGQYADRPDVVVLALPRGGVPVGAEVARALNVPLDVFLVRKLGVPGSEELAMGAIASGGVIVSNPEVIEALNISEAMFEEAAERERRELRRREQAYRGDRPMVAVEGRTVIVVDDGLATGTTMRAAIIALRRHHPARIVVAVPTAAPSTRDDIRGMVDECIVAITPEPFHAVGLWYDDFRQTTDEEVRALIEPSDLDPTAEASD